MLLLLGPLQAWDARTQPGGPVALLRAPCVSHLEGRASCWPVPTDPSTATRLPGEGPHPPLQTGACRHPGHPPRTEGRALVAAPPPCPLRAARWEPR